MSPTENETPAEAMTGVVRDDTAMKTRNVGHLVA